MTDLLDRPTTVAAAAEAPASTEAEKPIRPELWWLAAVLVGAGAIHLAMAPSHLGESPVEGVGFVVAAWAQLLLAVVVLHRPTRWVMNAVAISSALLIGAWGISRTSGFPFGEHSGHPESVSLVDGICVGLEAVAAFAAIGLIMRVVPRVLRARSFGVVGAIAAIAFATGAIASPSARNHAAHSHGDHHAHGSDSAAAAHSHGAATAADDKGFSELSNGHQHSHTQDDPLTPEETVLLSQQLAATSQLVERYPTIAAAEAAGWTRAGPFSPGLGTHYRGPTYAPNADGVIDPEDLLTPLLVFDGLGPDAKLAGFMYQAYGTTGEPVGFAGPNDHWHYHENVCIVIKPGGVIETPFGADLDGVTEQMCTNVGGMWMAMTGYMVHLWNVPGYESPDGMFTELNPKITCPDGTYHRIPNTELEGKDSVCLNP